MVTNSYNHNDITLYCKGRPRYVEGNSSPLDSSVGMPYFSSMRQAFKEWAIVVDALRQGEQIIVLRKGGLREGRGGFQIEQSEFWLFPTLFHQQGEAVVPKAQARYAEIAPQWPGPDVVRLECLARVVAWQRLESRQAAEALRGQHIWRDEVIAERFDWGRAREIHALAVRIYRLPAPIELPMRESYGGCKSWVELAEDIGTEDVAPVLDDEAFAVRLRQFKEALAVVAKPQVLP